MRVLQVPHNVIERTLAGGARSCISPSAMLSGLTRGFRLRAALMLAVLYALCVLGPAAALALTNTAMHCLTEQGAAHVHGQASAKSHAHADGADHQHHDDGATQEHSDAGKAASGNCCGLFCITALSHEPGFALLAPPATGRAIPVIVDALDGHGPDRLKRPPRT